MKKFPKQIYVRWKEPKDDDAFLVAAETLEDGEDGEKVAIYILKEVKTKRVVDSLE